MKEKNELINEIRKKIKFIEKTKKTVYNSSLEK